MEQPSLLIQLARMLAEQVRVNRIVRNELDALEATLIECDPNRKAAFERHLKKAEKEQKSLPASQTVETILKMLEQAAKEN
jgi:hypothetical protein